MADGDFMLNRILKITLDIYLCRRARDDFSHRSDLHQHALKLKQSITADNGFSMAGKNPVKFADGESVSEFGQAPFSGAFGCGMDRLKRYKYFADNTFLHLADAVNNSILTNWKWMQSLCPASGLEYRV
jgi:hypothetical protein